MLEVGSGSLGERQPQPSGDERFSISILPDFAVPVHDMVRQTWSAFTANRSCGRSQPNLSASQGQSNNCELFGDVHLHAQQTRGWFADERRR
jgi:hypothetical protein